MDLTGIKFIILSGNIGAGKTTVGRELSNKIGACFIEEPVEIWKKSGLLEQFYANPTKTAHSFQMYVLNTRVQALQMSIRAWRDKTGTSPAVVVLDRWIEDDRLFAELGKECGNISTEEYDSYMDAWSKVSGSHPITTKTTILIDVAPAVCYKRIISRDKKPIDREYLDALHQKHTTREYSIVVNGEGFTSDVVSEICASIVD